MTTTTLKIGDRVTVITGVRKRVCQITSIVHGKAGRIFTLKRIEDAGASVASSYAAVRPELRWTYTRKGDYIRILETFLNDRIVS